MFSPFNPTFFWSPFWGDFRDELNKKSAHIVFMCAVDSKYSRFEWRPTNKQSGFIKKMTYFTPIQGLLVTAETKIILFWLLAIKFDMQREVMQYRMGHFNNPFLLNKHDDSIRTLTWAFPGYFEMTGHDIFILEDPKLKRKIFRAGKLIDKPISKRLKY